MIEQRNLLLAMALSISILLGWNVLFPNAEPPATTETASGAVSAPGQSSDVALPLLAPGVTGDAPAAGASDGVMSRAAALAKSPRVMIQSPRVAGSIALKGGRIDDLTLTTYRETIDPDSPPVKLLSPSGSPEGYFAEFGWIGEKAGVAPGAMALWEATGNTLKAGSSIAMKWRGETGLVFERTISLDDDYMFTIEDSVRNESNRPQTLRPYGLVSRAGLPEISQLFVLYEGPIGVFNGTSQEVSYKDLMEDDGSGSVENVTQGGWLGMTDVYWLAAIIPDAATTVKARFLHHASGGKDRFQVDYSSAEGMLVAPGASANYEHHFFGGAKEVNLLDKYEAELGVENFDHAIDFGWFYFLTKPFFYALNWLYGILGNFGLAIMALTVGIKALFFPLANKSYKSMSQMKALQPEMVRLREKHGADRTKLNQEMMTLYKERKVNPAAGCLPIIVQIPVFFALYKTLIVTIEMRHAPFFGWIQDLSAPDPSNVFNLFGLIPFQPPEFLHLGAWALAMGLTMFLQQRLNPQPTDPVQARIFALMPVIFTVLLAGFAAGLVIYWTWNNLLSITQQAIIMKRQGVAIGRGTQKNATGGKA